MDGMVSKQSFDGLMELSEETEYSPSLEDIPWPDLHLECPGLLDQEITLPDTEPPETSTIFETQFEGVNVFLSNDGSKSGEDASVTFHENSSTVIYDENNNADYHNFCPDICSIMNDDHGIIASAMLDSLECNTGNIEPIDPENDNENSEHYSTFDEHLLSGGADDPFYGQAESSSPDPAPVANMQLHLSASSSLMPHTTMTLLPSPTSASMSICPNNNTEDDPPMPQPTPPSPAPHSSVSLDAIFALDAFSQTTSPPHSQPPSSEKQQVSGGASTYASVTAHETSPSPLGIDSVPATALPSNAIPASVVPSTPTTFPNYSHSRDELLLEVEDSTVKDCGPAPTVAPVWSDEPLSSIFLQHEVPQSLFKGYLLARFPLNLAHKLEMTRLGHVQKKTIKIVASQSDCSPDKINEEAMETAKVKLSSSRLSSGGAQHSLNVVIEPKQNELPAWSADVEASEGGHFLRIPSRQERMARQRAPIPQHPMKIKCPMCKLTYKHMGTLKRHLITKHEYFDDVEIIP